MKQYPPGELREYTLTCDPSVKVWIRQPTEGQKRRTANKGETVHFDIETGKVDDVGLIDLERLVARQERFVRGFVEKVEGKDASGNEFVDGDGLAENAVDDVIAEVALEVERSLSLGEERSKKSEASPG